MEEEVSQRHPCFFDQAHGKYGRIHLPVAPKCNLQCLYCNRKFNCVHESRPGVSANILTPKEAVAIVQRLVSDRPQLTVVGIAGPGDPMANPHETLETFAGIKRCCSHLLLCLSSNGLALPTYLDDLLSLGVHYVTITVNAVDVNIGAQLIRFAMDEDTKLEGREAAALLLERQEQSIRLLTQKGVFVKVNTVVIPNLNANHVCDIAEKVAQWGAARMNCIPLLPVAGTAFANCKEPEPSLIANVRKNAAVYLPQMWHCVRCRADAFGLLGEKTFLAQY